MGGCAVEEVIHPHRSIFPVAMLHKRWSVGMLVASSAWIPCAANAPSSVIASDVWADLHAGPNATVNVLVSFVGGTATALTHANSIDFQDLHLPSANSRVRRHLLRAAATSQATVLSVLRGDTAHPRRRLNDGSATHILSSPEICPGLDELVVREIYLTNQLYVRRMTLCMAEQLALRPEVESVRYGATFQLDMSATTQSPRSSSWNVDAVEASRLWSANMTGQGVVVGVIDTGVRSTHDVLRSTFRHDHGWFDAVAQTPTPLDTDGHGSHVSGIVMRVAPAAQWIACRACTGGGCRESHLLLCMQFMLCPTDPKGNDVDCSKAPRVVNNSWGSSIANLPSYMAAVQAWREAGIIPVFSGGNAGAQGCSSVTSPADYDNVIAVGSVDASRMLSVFSSTGPTVQFGRTKPDVVAPGVAISSASHQADDLYVEMTGTSMAAPHVTGSIALLLSGNPHLTYDQVYTALTEGASSVTGASSSCGGSHSEGGSNNLAGHGLVDVAKAGRLLELPRRRHGCGDM
ncbi:hypothetical protein H310_08177 [Aphanomyces invadans]|uniref:subtilisin n=1 Tax=Aphanomyces invadans TaxID=157072 RepID=A0A024TZS8_9STRA|nr:hypothetical protein H310_08177 [Aphanomyces invadans]ETV99503.1 hypothetical protein H310_08177 [Aphanomyces invadans]|eukprot:XP_008872059.1 hypothetical protein H310_08177 [Aphanomyces invadans]